MCILLRKTDGILVKATRQIEALNDHVGQTTKQGKTTGENQDKYTKDHAKETWTECYQDACLTHFLLKDKSGWFPRKPEESEDQESSSIKYQALERAGSGQHEQSDQIELRDLRGEVAQKGSQETIEIETYY